MKPEKRRRTKSPSNLTLGGLHLNSQRLAKSCEEPYFYTLYCEREGVMLFDRKRDANRVRRQWAEAKLEPSPVFRHDKTLVEKVTIELLELNQSILLKFLAGGKGELKRGCWIEIDEELMDLLSHADHLLEAIHEGQ